MGYYLVIAGSRNFDDYNVLRRYVDQFLDACDIPNSEVVVVSGTAKGADRLGERYARERGMKCIKMPADWDKYGKSAGYRRNEDMAKIATHCVVFWDGVSRGSKHMIDLALKHGVETVVVTYGQKDEGEELDTTL